MDSIVGLFVHIIIAVLVFSLFYWMVQLITSVPGIPEPMRATLRVVFLILLCLMAILFLLGDLGMIGTWGWGYHRRW
jgi:hypothetical protein